MELCNKTCSKCHVSISPKSRSKLCLKCRKHNNYLSIKDKVILINKQRWISIKQIEGRATCNDCNTVLNKNNNSGFCKIHYKQIITPDQRRIYQQNYKIKNSLLIKDKRLDRYKTDIEYKLRVVLRSRLNCAIKNNQKAGSAVKDLGCSIEELKRHLEYQWQVGMSWDNWGKGGKCWNIDHILPLDNFNLSNKDEFFIACNYKNLQPLWESDNLKKSNKIV